ncbi:SMI1/KNR4 family protein [Metabacillus fastidiosus]|uniref:SMI1/KNR4 family protein n=1 Tax=Metabacillus fastidiosus TaxID=1458 RepID=UPI003D2694DE
MIDLSNLPDLIKNNSASDAEIKEVEDLMKVKLPHTYKNLLKYTNGFSIGGGLLIYGTDDIIERNATWEVNEYANGYVAIGDDGGGNVFLMLQRIEETAVLMVNGGVMNPNYATVISSDFNDWINSGCFIETAEETTNDFPDNCSIILIKSPNGGLNGSKNLPFTLAQEFPYGKAKKLIEKLGELGSVLNLTFSLSKYSSRYNDSRR